MLNNFETLLFFLSVPERGERRKGRRKNRPRGEEEEEEEEEDENGGGAEGDQSSEQNSYYNVIWEEARDIFFSIPESDSWFHSSSPSRCSPASALVASAAISLLASTTSS